MSRRMPPAPTAASCWSSPTSRTLPPRSRTWPTARSRSRVSAMPASSMTTSVRGPIGTAPSRGWSAWSMACEEFGEGVGRAVERRRGARRRRRRTARARSRCRRRRSRPGPARAARWSCRSRPGRAPAAAGPRRWPVSRTRSAWPALRATPFAAVSSSASSIAGVADRRVRRCGAASSRRRCSAARIAGEVYEVGAGDR